MLTCFTRTKVKILTCCTRTKEHEQASERERVQASGQSGGGTLCAPRAPDTLGASSAVQAWGSMGAGGDGAGATPQRARLYLASNQSERDTQSAYQDPQEVEGSGGQCVEGREGSGRSAKSGRAGSKWKAPSPHEIAVEHKQFGFLQLATVDVAGGTGKGEVHGGGGGGGHGVGGGGGGE
jgi:hypothetical protein